MLVPKGVEKHGLRGQLLCLLHCFNSIFEGCYLIVLMVENWNLAVVHKNVCIRVNVLAAKMTSKKLFQIKILNGCHDVIVEFVPKTCLFRVADD